MRVDLSAAFFALAVLGSVAVVPSTAHALICSEPSEPYCIDDFDGFDRMEFESCRSDVESYLQNVEDYIDCMRREQQRVSEDANDVIEKFNCLAAGETYC